MALTRNQMDSVVKAEFARAAKGKPPLFAKARARLDKRRAAELMGTAEGRTGALKLKGLPSLVLAMAALSCGSTHALAQDSPAYRAGQQLGSLLFRKPDSDAYYTTLMEGLAARNAMAEAEQHREEADALEQLQAVRQALAAAWMKAGMSNEEAAAIAQAFTPSDSDDAVFLSVRGEPPQRVGADIRQALASRNYQLANQLLIGYLKAPAK